MPSRRPGTRVLVDGVGLLRSTYEAQIAEDLVARGIAPHYEEHTLYYEKPYIMDFGPLRADGTPVLIEAKGWMPSQDRTKILALLRDNPELELHMLFQRASSRLSKNSKTTYGQWANQHGIVWAEGLMPEEWLR